MNKYRGLTYKGRSPKQRLSHVAEGLRVAEDHIMKKSFVLGFVSVPLLLFLFLLSLHFLLCFSPSPSPSLSGFPPPPSPPSGFFGLLRSLFPHPPSSYSSQGNQECSDALDRGKRKINPFIDPISLAGLADVVPASIHPLLPFPHHFHPRAPVTSPHSSPLRAFAQAVLSAEMSASSPLSVPATSTCQSPPSSDVTFSGKGPNLSLGGRLLSLVCPEAGACVVGTLVPLDWCSLSWSCIADPLRVHFPEHLQCQL